MNLADFIFPKKCVSCDKFGAYFCVDCIKKVKYVDMPICPVCQRQSIGGRTHPGCFGKYRPDGLVVACRYQDPIRRAIAKVKYKWVFDIEKVFVDLIVSCLWQIDLPKDIVLVPVPLHAKRENWRGFNQSDVLAKSLSKKFKAAYLDLMFRNKETQTQVGLRKDERLTNVRGAFSLRTQADVRGKNIVLVDDVFTSGATMAECAKVLKENGAKSVWGMAVALG